MSTLQEIVGAHGLSFATGGVLQLSYTDAITAHAGGGQANAVVLTTNVNNVTTVATAGDSVKLPAATTTNGTYPDGPTDNRGVEFTVINSGANTLAVFPDSGSTINALAANASVNVPATGIVTFRQTSSGAWFTQDTSSQLVRTLTASGLITANGGITMATATLLNESAADTITAHASGGQASATALTSEINRVTTVATAGDSVKLPASAPGLSIIVINHGANPMQVFGAGTDTIDDVATATGVSQMQGSVALYECTTAGAWYSEGIGTGYSGGLQTLSFTPTITAHSGGGQGSAVALTTTINRVSTVAAQGDSVALPASAVGLAITVVNRGANPMQVFGNGTDTINGIATATGISQGINTSATYICNVAGNWEIPLTSLQSTSPQALSASGAIPAHVGHTYVVTKAGVAALTLAAPTAGTDDGIEITVTSSTANAHTITATGLLQTGTASVNVATFAAQPGAGVTLMAYNAKWIVLASVGITFS